MQSLRFSPIRWIYSDIGVDEGKRIQVLPTVREGCEVEMKMVRVEMVVYYEAQDSTTVEEAKDVVVDLAEMNGLKVQFSQAELIWDNPDEVE